MTRLKSLVVVVWDLPLQGERQNKPQQACHGDCISFMPVLSIEAPSQGFAAQRLRDELCLFPVIKFGSFFHKGKMTQDIFNLISDSAYHFQGSCSSFPSRKTRCL